ncbi:hypothetical protein E5676_scaffold3819G00030 [Cucumis melo var. makuwa]|uniref:Uncharacterized protein n=1 Tax=Cucumis melo var. makuwa TaxID=1194695 RepID=A0A5D3DH61_CUCMM|nr:hypothetical protein E6C27_scaffold22G00420 [Cucumis melo var. makuwa]TYK23037.1 hypothetical protein E5676_scaffold3819G00030 [Cucumis melo var. makuwa]
MPSAIQLLLWDNRAFAVRSTTLIHRPGWSNQAPSSFEEVTMLSTIQLLLRDDRSFAIRSTALIGIHRPRRRDQTPSSFGEVTMSSMIQLLLIDRAPSSFGEVTMSSVIQLLLGDDLAFAVRSTVLVGAIDNFIIWRGGSALSDPTSTRDDRAFTVRSTVLRTIELLPSDPPPCWEQSSTFIIWRGGSAVSDPTRTKERSGFYRQTYHPSRSDLAPSSFRDVTMSLAIQLLLEDDRAFIIRSTSLVGAIGHFHCLER